MQDAIFATFLYVAMFCLVCCLRYKPGNTATIATINKEQKPAADMHQVSTTEPEQKTEPANAVTEDTLATPDPWDEPTEVIEPETVKAVEPEPLNTANTLNVEKLTLRQCRDVIREINKSLPKADRIRQKINGKDASVGWLRGQITRYLENNPAATLPVKWRSPPNRHSRYLEVQLSKTFALVGLSEINSKSNFERPVCLTL